MFDNCVCRYAFGPKLPIGLHRSYVSNSLLFVFDRHSTFLLQSAKKRIFSGTTRIYSFTEYAEQQKSLTLTVLPRFFELSKGVTK